MVRAALSAVDAGALVRTALRLDSISRALGSADAVDVVAVGKAARSMVLEALQPSPRAFRRVIAISNQPAGDLPPGIDWHHTAHPVPDARSVAAAHAVMVLTGRAAERDLILVLLSGGASAMMALPAARLSLEDKQQASEQLLRAGAEVHALNAVRKHLSAIKGGQLAAGTRAAVLALLVSDVVGDEPSAIGSGPTVADSTTFADAVAALVRYGGTQTYPAAVVAHLMAGVTGAIPETPKAGDSRLVRSTTHIIGSGLTAIIAGRAAAERLGYSVHLVDTPVTGAARAAGQALVERAAAAKAVLTDAAPLCVMAAGETTVRVIGHGRGGRNQECALGMVRGLNSAAWPAVGASVGTDGIDGPTDAAGAVADTTTLSRAAEIGLDVPERYLDENDSYTYFDRLGDLVRTGPTNTNVGDLQVILIG